MKIKIKKKDIKKNKNIILIIGGLILVILLYFALSPYQQCVRGYVKMSYDASRYENRPQSQAKAAKARHKARGQVLCAKRMN